MKWRSEIVQNLRFPFWLGRVVCKQTLFKGSIFIYAASQLAMTPTYARKQKDCLYSFSTFSKLQLFSLALL